MTVHNLGGMAPMALDAAGVSSGQAMLVGELEKRDPRLMEPLTSVTWMRDIVAETGGGYVETTSNYFVDYATSGANEFGVTAGQTNNINVIQANISKDIFKVLNFSNIIKVPFIDSQKMAQIGRSLDQIFDDGLRLNYNKALDQNTYLGFESFGTAGLVNNPNITASLAPLNAGATSRLWANKTADEILADINTVLSNAWAASEYDLSGMPNHILLPPANFTTIVNRKVSDAGNVSILTYLKENNIAAAQGVEVQLVPCRQAIGQGLPLTTGGAATNRMVAYVNAENRVSMDLPVPLSRAMTQPSVNDLAYLTAFIGLIGEVKFKYTQCAQYLDGI